MTFGTSVQLATRRILQGMERDFVWHVKAICWIAVVLGLTMAISGLYTAGATITAIGFAVALLINRHQAPARSGQPADPD